MTFRKKTTFKISQKWLIKNLKFIALQTLFFFNVPCFLLSSELSKMSYVMGTLLQIELETDSKIDGERAMESALTQTEELDALLSNYKDSSEISKINKEAGLESVPVHEKVIDLLAQTMPLMDKTNGAFDITIEPLTKIWKLRERELKVLPEPELVAGEKEKVNYKNIEFSTAAKTFRFLKTGMGLDTGGVGKGYALDKTLEKITNLKINSATLNFGGEILYWCKTPCEKKFSIKNPLNPEKSWQAFKIKKNSKSYAISTTANYERFITALSQDGKKIKLSHILNPQTGWPVNNEIESVTVIGKNALDADILSTAIFVMGLKKGKEFSESLKQEAVYILYRNKESNKNLKIFESRLWRKICMKQP